MDTLPTDPRFMNLIGRSFGILTVIGYAGKKKGDHYWLVRCECGKEKETIGIALRQGSASSCGCIRSARVAAMNKANSTHGKSQHGLYQIWYGIIKRCTKSGSRKWKDYGGRGIKVCERWIQSIDNFIADMGPRPSKSHSVERKDNNGHYEPSNCKWATAKEQGQNKRNNRKLETKRG